MPVMDGVLPGHMDGVLPGHMDWVLPGHLDQAHGWGLPGHMHGVLPGHIWMESCKTTPFSSNFYSMCG